VPSRRAALLLLAGLSLATQGCSLGLRRKVTTEDITRSQPGPSRLEATLKLGAKGILQAHLETSTKVQRFRISKERWFTGRIYSDDRELFMVLLYPLDAVYNLVSGLDALGDPDYDVRWGPLGVLWSVIMPGVTCADSGVAWNYYDNEAIGEWETVGEEELVSTETKVESKAPLANQSLSLEGPGGYELAGRTNGKGELEVELAPIALAYFLSSETTCVIRLRGGSATATLEIPEDRLAKVLDALPQPRNAWHWAHVLGHSQSRRHQERARARLKGTGYPSDFVAPSLTPVLVGATREGRLPEGGRLDWSLARPSLPPSAQVEVFVGEAAGGGEVVAGQPLVLRVRARNAGHGPLYRLRGELSCDALDLSKRTLLFGKISPGETVERLIRIPTPKTLEPGQVTLRVTFVEANGYPPPPTRARFAIKGAEKPAITLSVQAFDDGSGTSTGNGDGVVQRGEAVELRVTVNNLGGAGVRKAALSIHVPATTGVQLFGKQSYALGEILPGATLTRAFTVSVKPGFKGEEFPLEIRFREGSVFRIQKNLSGKVRIDQEAPQRITSIDRQVRVTRKTLLLAGASPKAKRLGEVEAGALLRARGELGPYLLVTYGERRAWVSSSDVKFDLGAEPAHTSGEGRVTVVKEFANTPPLVALRTGSGRTAAAVLRLQGKARDDKAIRSLQFRVDGKLVDPSISKGPGRVVKRARRAKEKEVAFTVSIPLHPGANRIEVVATDDQGLEGRDEILIERVEERGQVHAVVIGISAYAKVRPLSYARGDAIAFRDYLRDDLGVPAKNLHLLVDQQATLPRIKRLLGRTLPRAVGKHDTVLVYFSGHGGREADAAAPEGQAAYLYPVGADEQDLIATAYPMEDLERSFRRIQAQRLVFLADSCYSGSARDPKAAAQAKGGARFLQLLTKGKGRVILSACQADQVAQESKRFKRGLFTHYLLEGLKGGRADVNGDRAVDTDELYTYVSQRVAKTSGQTQHPEKSGSGRVILGGR
jgi:caspase domain-containing protein